MHTRVRLLAAALCLVLAVIGAFSLQAQTATVAISGATLIDGAGGPPTRDAVVLVSGGRITAAGPRASIKIPEGATVIDAAGKYLLPGLIDTNVHLSLYGGMADRYETLARYHPRQEDIVLEAAQLQLSYGVTTVRDSYVCCRRSSRCATPSRRDAPSVRAFWRRAISSAGAARIRSASA